MVYLNNDNNKQDVYIPRNDGQGSYVNPCDKCYQAGYKDGCEECGNVNLEDKSVVVTAATQTVFPSSGYDAMTSVDVDATEWGQSKYDEGYDEGYGNGEDDQKARLSSATFVENGEYTLEDGWSAVTVQTTCPPPSLEDKNFYLESGFTPTTITPSSGYDGLSSVRVEDHGYGQERYDTGYDAGQEAQRHKLVSTAITANGIYSRADGYSQIDVQVPVEVPCNIENGVSINLINYPGYETTVVPSSGYAGLASVHADGSGIYTQGVLDVANQFVPLTATTNGVYLPQSQYAVFSSVTVNVPCTACTLQTKNDTMTASTQTFTADNLVRPTAPSGETVYGGSIELLEDLIDQYERITIMSWDNAQHSDWTEQGYFQYDNGEYMFYNYQADIPYPFSSLTSSWSGVAMNDGLLMMNDGLNIFFYEISQFGIVIRDNVPITLNELILPVDGYDGLSAVTVSASALCQDYYSSGYTSGYTDGLNDCPLPNLENKTLYLNSGDTSPWTVVPSSGYDGMSRVTVRDNGYGQKKYNDGYNDGYADATAAAKQPVGLKLDGYSWFDTGLYPDSSTTIELFIVPTFYNGADTLYLAGCGNSFNDNSSFYVAQNPFYQGSSDWSSVNCKFGSCRNDITINEAYNTIEQTVKMDSGNVVSVRNYNEGSEVHAYEYNGFIIQEQAGDIRYNQETKPVGFSGMDACNYTIFLGANNNPSLANASPAYSPAKCILLGAKIYNNGTLVGEFVPRLNGGIPCLYDTVNQTYIPNSGTGTVTPIFGEVSLNARYI